MAEDLREFVDPIISHHLGSDARPRSISKIATGRFNTSYSLEADGRALVLRIAPDPEAEFLFYEKNMMAQEPAVHKIVRERTGIPVPEIVAYDDSRALVPRDYLIMERLPGKPLTSARVSYDKVLGQVGQFLRELHEITADQYGYLGAHCPMAPQDDWAAAFRIMWDKLIDDVSRVGWYDEEESRALRDLLCTAYEHFDRSVPSSLLHMDIWHENILVDDAGQVTGILDWDRALWGDPEIEFAVLDYCGISEPAFWRTYERDRELSPAAQTRRLFYFLYELQKYIVIREGRHHDSASARQYKTQVMQLLKSSLV